PGGHRDRRCKSRPRTGSIGAPPASCHEGGMRAWDVCAAGLGCWFFHLRRARTGHLAKACLPTSQRKSPRSLAANRDSNPAPVASRELKVLDRTSSQRRRLAGDLGLAAPHRTVTLFPLAGTAIQPTPSERKSKVTASRSF